MKWWRRWGKQVRGGDIAHASEGVERARRARIASEARLEATRRDVIIPLHELRRENHFAHAIIELTRRKDEGTS